MYKFEKFLVELDQTLKRIAIAFIGRIQFFKNILHNFKEFPFFANLRPFEAFQIITENIRWENAKFSKLLLRRLLFVTHKELDWELFIIFKLSIRCLAYFGVELELSFQNVQVLGDKLFHTRIALFEQKLDRFKSEFVLQPNENRIKNMKEKKI